MRLGKMIFQVLESVLMKPATLNYPHDKCPMPAGFRGKLKFYPDKCVGCRMCVRDCPSKAITINETGPRQFSAEIDLSKCIYCAQCVDSCFKKAIEATAEYELAQLDKSKLKAVFLHEGAKGETEKQS